MLLYVNHKRQVGNSLNRRQGQTSRWSLIDLLSLLCLMSVLPVVAVIVDAGGNVNDVQLLMYETEVTAKPIMAIQASNIPGLTASIVGQGTKFEGFGSKYDAVIPHLRQFDPDTLVVLSDARDVIINEPAHREYSAEEIKSISAAVLHFRQQVDHLATEYPGAIILSAEAQCCVGALTYAKMGDYIPMVHARNGLVILGIPPVCGMGMIRHCRGKTT
jgi:hypothetical protein